VKTLADYGDVLTVREVCELLQISDRTYRRLRDHSAWPIPELPSLTPALHRFTKAAVQRYLDSGGAVRLRRSA
jgi:predicted DNA-binding transcriptional regulator AlpA